MIPTNLNELQHDAHSRIQTYTEPVLLKYGKLATEYPWIYRYFYSVVKNQQQTSSIQNVLRELYSRLQRIIIIINNVINSSAG